VFPVATVVSGVVNLGLAWCRSSRSSSRPATR
jgi:hypothetical protein